VRCEKRLIRPAAYHSSMPRARLDWRSATQWNGSSFPEHFALRDAQERPTLIAAGKPTEGKTGELRLFRTGCEDAAEKCGADAMFSPRTGARVRPSAQRVAAVCICALLVPPFVALALVPMALMLIPVAFVVLPFMITAFFPGAHANSIESKHIALWRPAVLIPLVARHA